MKLTTTIIQLTFTFLFVLFSNVLFAQALSYGDAVTGQIATEGQLDTYTFEGATGDVILIRMRGTSGGVDGCMELFDPSGNSIASDCDDGGLVKIDGLTLNATGTYTLEAHDSGDNDTGPYGLGIHLLSNGSSPNAITTGNASTMISCGDDVMHSLDHNAQINGYSFQGKAGNEVLIQMRSAGSSLESQLKLYDAAGNQIAEGVTVTGLTSITGFTLPTDGAYTIFAMDENGNDQGFYGLSLQLLNAVSCAESIECGSDIAADIGLIAEVDAYTFSGKKSDHVFIQMAKNNTSMESRLELYNSAGELLEMDLPASGLATIEIASLPADDEYLLLIKDDKGNDTGGYTLSYQVLNNTNCAETFDCANNSFTADLENEGEIDVYAVELDGGTYATIRMRGVLNGVDSHIKLYSPSGAIMQEDYANSAMAEIVDIKIPETGVYTIAVSDRNGNDTGEYGFSMQVVPGVAGCATNLNCDSGTISTGFTHFAEMDVYTFKAEERQLLTVVMTEIDVALEPILKLYGPDGSLIGEEIKSLHADFTNFAIPESGTYTLLAMDKNGNDIGDYTIDYQLDNENGTSTCFSCTDGVQNGDETGIDCGGLNCAPCCMPAETACTICPEDLTIICNEIDSDMPMPVSITGAGTYDMTIKFDEKVAIAGECVFGDQVTFDNGCIGLRTGCWNKNFKLTPDFGTCGGPLPELPFTIDFGNNYKVFFDAQGNASVVDNNNIDEQITTWLNSVTGLEACGVMYLEDDFNETGLDADCNTSKLVTFKGVDVCGNISYCSATITLTDGSPICPNFGTACDDGDLNTFNDVEDGNCNCAGAPYCTSAGQNTDYEYIEHFALDGISNTSGNDGGYGDYTSMSTTVMKGTEQGIELVPGFASDSYNEAWQVWIDFNRDGDFEDDGELIFSGIGSGTLTGTAAIPMNATSGDSRMRIAMQYVDESSTTSFEPCDIFGYGEVEDYTVSIIDFACPVAGTTCDDGDAGTVNDMEDGDCNCVGEELVAETCGTGTISRDIFLGVEGYPLSNIDWNSAPDVSDELDIFEIPINQYEHYGTRLRGYLCAPQTGNYTFWIASDDKGTLWLSKDDSPENIQLVAEVPGWTAPRQWDKYPEQKSFEIYLEEGQSYYVEAYMKEHEGLDNLAVGWQLPDGVLERPILGANLSPWNGPSIESVDTGNEIIENNAVVDMQVFPNPAKDIVTVDLSDFIGQTVQVSLTNSMGQVIYTQQIENLSEQEVSINLQSAQTQSGYYSITVSSTKQIIAKPLIISKGGF